MDEVKLYSISYQSLLLITDTNLLRTNTNLLITDADLLITENKSTNYWLESINN